MDDAAVEVDARDVVKLLLQFCRENGLPATGAALRAESGVALDSVDSLEALRLQVLEGRWEAVLPDALQLALPPDVLADVHEQVVLELLECREAEAARALLRSAPALAHLRASFPPRAARLDALLAASPSFDPDDAWPPRPGAPPGGGRAAARAALAARLCANLRPAPPARLLALLGCALKWLRHTGALPPAGAPGAAAPGSTLMLDLFTGAHPGAGATGGSSLLLPPDAAPGGEARCVRFGSRARCTAAAFTPDGRALLCGTSDGFVEVRDPATAALRTDLAYQAPPGGGGGDGGGGGGGGGGAAAMMLHERGPVTALAASPDSELLASAGGDGGVRAWRLATGKCVRAFPPPSSSSGGCVLVNSLQFSRDSASLLAAASDGAVRVYGLRSGRLLRELGGPGGGLGAGGGISGVGAAAAAAGAGGHDGPAACACWADAAQRWVASAGGADGALRVWDARTGEQATPLLGGGTAGGTTGGTGGASAAGPLLAVALLPRDALLVVPAAGPLRVLPAGVAGAIAAGLGGGGGGGGGGGAAAPPPAPMAPPANDGFAAAGLSPRGALVYGLSRGGALLAFDAATGKLEATLVAHPAGAAAGLAAHPRANVVATFGEDGTLRLFR